MAAAFSSVKQDVRLAYARDVPCRAVFKMRREGPALATVSMLFSCRDSALSYESGGRYACRGMGTAVGGFHDHA